MTTAIFETDRNPGLQTIEPAEMSELVRGASASLLERLGPLAAEGDLTLDLAGVQRIDAAGIGTLLAMYRNAREAGHSFSLINVPARVKNILLLVGLDEILLSHNPVQDSHYGSRLCRSAA